MLYILTMGRRAAFFTATSLLCLMANAETFFLIGKPDAASREFKIFRNIADTRYTYQRDFTEKHRPFRDIDGLGEFFKTPFTFTVGKSKTSDFPFLHPITSERWLDINYKAPIYSIEFDTPKNMSKNSEESFLKIGLSDLSKEAVLNLRVELNGEEIGSFKDIGRGVEAGASLIYFPKTDGIAAGTFVFKVPNKALKTDSSKNVFKIIPSSKGLGDAWFTYDYIEYSSSPEISKIKDIRDSLLDAAIKAMGSEEIVICSRGESRDWHWYSNIGRTSYAKTGNPDIDRHFDAELFTRLGGKLSVFNLKTGKLRHLINDPTGAVRDLRVSYDGKKILFSYLKGGTDNFNLYEIDADGKNLKKLPVALDGYDDIEPCYLPNGDIVFASNRTNKTVQCFFMPVTDIHRWYREENKVAALTFNPDVDSTPNVLADGRIIYMRWDYNQRNQLAFHHLWAMNPDGSNDMAFLGNNKPGGLFIDPSQIPDQDGVVFAFKRGHSGRDHIGHIARALKPFDSSDFNAVEIISGNNGIQYADPLPIGGGMIIASDKKDVIILSEGGQYVRVKIPDEFLHTQEKAFMNVVRWKSSETMLECKPMMRSPRPLVAHKAPESRPDMVDFSQKTARVFLQNVYHGRNMEGVKKGEIKKLLIQQVLPTPAHYNGGSNPLNRIGGFALEKILGTVPVYEDGSANFEVPANRALNFTALDENGNSVKRMQSFVNFPPGTSASCIGCHEMRSDSPIRPKALPLAYKKISKIEPLEGVPEIIDFRRHVQPILDKYCLECHNHKTRKGGAVLSGSLGPNFIHSYIALDELKQMRTGQNSWGNLPPHTFGSGSSQILKKAEGGHKNKRLDDKSLAILRAWLDTGSMQVGSYAAINKGFLHTYWQGGTIRLEDKLPHLPAAEEAMAQSCDKCHSGEAKIPRRLFEPPTNYGEVVFQYREAFEERAVDKIKYIDKDGKIEESKLIAELLYNLSEPENSLALVVPLAKSAGGTAEGIEKNSHPIVFKDKNDPNYKNILAALSAISEHLKETAPFQDSPKFTPTDGYLKVMQKCKILPPNFDFNTPLDAQEIDEKYFKWQEDNAVRDIAEK